MGKMRNNENKCEKQREKNEKQMNRAPTMKTMRKKTKPTTKKTSKTNEKEMTNISAAGHIYTCIHRESEMKPLKDQAHTIWLHLIIVSFMFHGASHSVSGSIPLGMSINSHYVLFSWFRVLTGPKHLNATMNNDDNNDYHHYSYYYHYDCYLLTNTNYYHLLKTTKD